MNKKFAFESGKVSIAFGLRYGLGDSVVAKKVFDALVEIEPDCAIDIFYKETQHRAFAEAFYGGSKNLNGIFSHEKFYEKHVARYDLAVWVVGTHCVIFDGANVERLQTAAPNLLLTALQIQQYNKENVLNFKPLGYAVPLRNVMMSRILHRNFFYFLSCGGALPICDECVELKLSPAHRRDFDKLKLGKYITIYSNLHRDAIRPKAKTWPIQHLREYVARIKNKFPRLTTVQVGGGGEILKLQTSTENFWAATWS